MKTRIVECLCGCGGKIVTPNKSYNEVKWIRGHHFLKTKLSERGYNGKTCKECGEKIFCPGRCPSQTKDIQFCSALCSNKNKTKDPVHMAKYYADPKRKRSEEHYAAKWWRVRSPMNVVYEFKNLHVFIKNNPSLFDPETIVYKKYGPTLSCRAYKGIGGLRPNFRNTRGSWRGWTWYSQTERLKNDGNDLLDRATSASPDSPHPIP